MVMMSLDGKDGATLTLDLDAPRPPSEVPQWPQTRQLAQAPFNFATTTISLKVLIK